MREIHEEGALGRGEEGEIAMAVGHRHLDRYVYFAL